MKILKIGTRGSKLALKQTNIVCDLIKVNYPDVETEIVIIKTKGDIILDKPLSDIGDKGLFVSEIEDALLSGKIDIAIHSGKDLPSKLAEGLDIVSTPIRTVEKDVLIKCKGHILSDSPIIGTSSPRREFYIKKMYPNANLKFIRGNIDTRLNKLLLGEYDAIVLAKAGLDRLAGDYDKFDIQELSINQMLPAPCQGILAIEAKKDLDFDFSKITDKNTFMQFQIERKVLNLLDANCHEPVAVFCEILSEEIFTLYIMYKGIEISKSFSFNEIDLIEDFIRQVK